MRFLTRDQADELDGAIWEALCSDGLADAMGDDGLFFTEALMVIHQVRIQVLEPRTAKLGDVGFCEGCERWKNWRDWKPGDRVRVRGHDWECAHPDFDGETCPKEK